MRKTIKILVMVAGIVLSGLEAQASISAGSLSLQELSDRSSLIVRGTIMKTESSWNTERTKIFTYVEIEIEEYIKGEGEQRLVFRIPGGTAEGITEVHSVMPGFMEGEKVLLFLDPGHPYSDVTGAYQGKFTISGDEVVQRGIPAHKFIQETKALSQGSQLLEIEEEPSVQSDDLVTPLASAPVITKVTPSSASAGTHSVVTIEGNNFGSTQGAVYFRATAPNVTDRRPNLSLEAPIVSWSNTQIKCEVPVAIFDNLYYSAGTFDDAIYVFSNGIYSSPAPFYVTFGYMGHKWPADTMRYYINEDTEDCTGEGAEVQAAASLWNALSNFRFEYAGTTASTDYGMNGKNEFLWVHYDTKPLGLEMCWRDSSGNVVECDIVLGDASVNWNTNGTMSGLNWDVQAFAIHELGHWLGLVDLYGDKDMTKVMGRVNDRQSPSADDIAGIQYLYGVNPNAKPNLAPYLPGGWSDKIVVANGKGTQTDSNPLYSTDTLYVDWAFINNGIAPTGSRLYYDLYVDGNKTSLYMDNSLNPGHWGSVLDHSVGSLSPGNHTIRVVLDPTNTINESDENDNEYVKTITVLGSGKPNFTPHLPGGWSDKIVVANGKGTQTDSSPLYSTDSLYLDWAWINNGSAPISTTLYYDLYLDGTLKTRLSMTATVNVNQWNSQIDYPIGSLSPGTHTIRLVLDPDNTISESNENDNEYTKTITVLAPPTTNFTLTVLKSGAGDGTVASSPEGIACGADCSEAYTAGTAVSLTASASSGSTFEGWSGGGCSGTGPCSLTMNSDITVTARFEVQVVQKPDLTGHQPGGWSDKIVVSKTTGTNTDSSPLYSTDTLYLDWAWINNGSAPISTTLYYDLYLDGTLKTRLSMTATFNVNQWNSQNDYPIGSLSPGTHTIRVVLDPDNAINESNENDNEYTKTITVLAPPTTNFTLTVLKSGAGDGTVTSSPEGITCGANCSKAYNAGTAVSLTASASPGSTFEGWSGGGCSGTGPCSLTMNSDITVTARFGSGTPTLTVVKSGTGTGTVTSSPSGINCGNDCSEDYPKGKKVTLSAKADTNSLFAGWSGGECSGTGKCAVVMDTDVVITAAFSAKIPDISASPGPVDFGSVKVGKNSTKTLKILNNGSGDLVVAISGTEGTDFSIKGNSNLTIKAKKSYNLSVTLAPKSPGPKTAKLRLSSNDPDTPVLEIPLTGTGQ